MPLSPTALLPSASSTPSPSPSPTPSGAASPTSSPVVQTPTAVNDVVEHAPSLLRPWLSILIPVAVAAVITLVAGFIVDRLLIRFPVMRTQVRRLRVPVFALMLTLGLSIGTDGLVSDPMWAGVLKASLKVAVIVSATWVLVVAVSVFERSLLEHYREAGSDVSHLAKMRTQVTLLRRVVTAVVLIVGVGGVLLMIPAVQKLGTTLLASAGLASVVVGLAVQGVLANVFAGLQVAFTDAIRVDDVVFVEQEQGTISEITLTYVVVAMADGRSMILPSTYFTTQPFENWSRGGTALTGNVAMDLNWNAPVERLRHRVTQLLEASDVWDGRVGTTQVVAAEGGIVKVTITVSARNSGDLWALKNEIRERLVADLQEKYPEALPRQMFPPQA